MSKTIENEDIQKEIRDVIAANKDKLPAVLHGYWHRSAGDFIAGGIERKSVADSMFTVAVMHQIAALGVDRAVALLREVADLHEGYGRPDALREPTTH